MSMGIRKRWLEYVSWSMKHGNTEFLDFFPWLELWDGGLIR